MHRLQLCQTLILPLASRACLGGEGRRHTLHLPAPTRKFPSLEVSKRAESVRMNDRKESCQWRLWHPHRPQSCFQPSPPSGPHQSCSSWTPSSRPCTSCPPSGPPSPMPPPHPRCQSSPLNVFPGAQQLELSRLHGGRTSLPHLYPALITARNLCLQICRLQNQEVFQGGGSVVFIPAPDTQLKACPHRSQVNLYYRLNRWDNGWVGGRLNRKMG